MIQLAKDIINKEDIEALSAWLLTFPRLTQSDLVRDFEAKFAAKMGSKYGVFVNSGSSANLLTIYGLICSGLLQKGDKVVLPAVCWATDIAPVVQLGLEPVLCDINLRNLAIDTTELESILKIKKPKVLILVSVLGLPPDMEDVSYLCRKYNCILLLDNCESLGSKYNGFYLETFGFASTMSLYFAHQISTIEGGMVFTNDHAFYNVLKMIRSHGWSRDCCPDVKQGLSDLHGVSDFESFYTFYHPGFNFRSTELNAFLGLRQLDKIDEFSSKREYNFDMYQRLINNILWKPEIPKENFVSNLGYPVIVGNRLRMAKAMAKADIECRPLISGNIARHPAYKDLFPGKSFINADLVHENGMYLPNHPFLSAEEVYDVCKVFNENV